jgi:putative oxidoreductase
MNPTESKEHFCVITACGRFARLANYLRCPLLLAMRLYWGWQFFLSGKGKLMNLDRTTGFFESIHIPLPHLNAILAGSVECFGGLLLLFGLFSRVISVPLIFTMIIAYVTAERESLNAIFSDPDKFVSAAPFQFLFVCLIVLAFGPGRISLDALIARKCGGEKSSCETGSSSCCEK